LYFFGENDRGAKIIAPSVGTQGKSGMLTLAVNAERNINRG
jgi:hypothetical protein